MYSEIYIHKPFGQLKVKVYLETYRAEEFGKLKNYKIIYLEKYTVYLY